MAGTGQSFTFVAIWQLLLCAIIGLLLDIQSLAQFAQCHDQNQDIFYNETGLSPEAFPYDDESRCEPIKISFCDEVEYKHIKLPNIFGHSTQAEVESDINVYEPLVKLGCSSDLRLFLCTVYAPMCVDLAHGSGVKILRPCQSLCESARKGCGAQLKLHNLDWPEPLRCEKFPDGRLLRKDDDPCVGNDSTSYPDPSLSSEYLPRDPPTRELGFVCPKNFEVPSYSFQLNGRRYNNCALPCEEVYLDKDGHRITRILVGIFATVCILSTIFTCATFLIDTKRFEYPARPIIIIAFCQLAVGLCYLIGSITHNRISCNDPVDPPRALPNMKMIRSATFGNKKGSCTLLFMALYFFQLSGALWWLMMTISWVMIAKLRWAAESVSSISRYFHFISWTLPALLTLYLSVLGEIEGDSLSGTCFMSTSGDSSTISAFLLIPVTICLILGCILLATGFKSIWDVREALRLKFGTQTAEHFRLVIRIGLYSLLYIIFTLIFLYAHYHSVVRETIWKMAWLSNVCRIRDYSIPCPTQNYANLGPHYLTFVVRYAASMAIGMISGLFVASGKTVKAYQEATAMYVR